MLQLLKLFRGFMGICLRIQMAMGFSGIVDMHRYVVRGVHACMHGGKAATLKGPTCCRWPNQCVCSDPRHCSVSCMKCCFFRGAFAVVLLYSSHVDGVNVDGRIDRCFARH